MYERICPTCTTHAARHRGHLSLRFVYRQSSFAPRGEAAVQRAGAIATRMQQRRRPLTTRLAGMVHIAVGDDRAVRRQLSKPAFQAIQRNVDGTRNMAARIFFRVAHINDEWRLRRLLRCLYSSGSDQVADDGFFLASDRFQLRPHRRCALRLAHPQVILLELLQWPDEAVGLHLTEERSAWLIVVIGIERGELR